MDIFGKSRAWQEFFYAKQVRQSAQFAHMATTGNYPTTGAMMLDAAIYTSLILLLNLFLSFSIFQYIVDFALGRGPKVPFQSEELEKLFETRKLSLPSISELKEVQITPKRTIEDMNRWFKMREQKERLKIKKQRCKEGLFRMMMYSICLICGVVILVQPKWMANESYDFLVQPIYTLKYIFERQYEPNFWELSYFTKLQIPMYCYFTLNHFMESFHRLRGRGFSAKVVLEFAEMFIHHLVSLTLLTMGYFGNFLYLLTFGLVLHDSTDVFLEASKLSNYFEWTNLSVLLFSFLNFMWGYCRIYIYLNQIIIPLFLTNEDGTEWRDNFWKDAVMGKVKRYFFVLSILILGMNLYWFVFITRVNVRVMLAGVDQQKRDRAMTDLSSDEEQSELETEEDEDDDDVVAPEQKKEK